MSDGAPQCGPEECSEELFESCCELAIAIISDPHLRDGRAHRWIGSSMPNRHSSKGEHDKLMRTSRYVRHGI
ncbi:Protein of unknown function [Pyronema omphalodes CBS 100304]|uniref:Uncharacterized protein n=1 Tax=Pyronema omphalodes (strain CBS 100304) TaxID=1076935 RepID=U4L5K8_PYROM|nr:Protein of unknown function [Pyronema omphalodes CBS 100304]